MKKIYSIACSLLAMLSFAQQTVSFEDSEGFTIGNIHGQGPWISTPTGGNPENVIHQTISTDNATNGSSALKIVRETMYGVQSEPVIGGFCNLVSPLNTTNFSVSFDINMSQLDTSIFGFQGIDNINEQMAVRVDFDKTGVIKILDKNLNVQNLVSTSGIWTPNTWHRFKIVGTAIENRYYLNDTLIYSEPVSNPLTMDQLRFVHNNGMGTAYFDNIKINDELILSVKEAKANSNLLTVYPNPVTDFLKISSVEKINDIEMFDLQGKKVRVELNNNTINMKTMIPGLYFVKITTEKNRVLKKILKK
ncbi:T9SS type A sorting domain-containing protein [Chryseobacterium sp. BIGb0232]|uniref:T9SS type A sorting domain-containing protein n=1 Tax=Chryseobacterium sp. BIGb0232 TaxID=2940598 RepID=UPI000F4AA24D|nr:T9SS type A sorting domain-containing protein [Chryseobacterium sp. BIGb0232]MCS4304650.1 hypothetical protein [Chryseobacterium sp. BIGb0232]ROS20690.1 putative secreted protein (Por secretion system target) [Chryseobacterium nakagawai]